MKDSLNNSDFFPRHTAGSIIEVTCVYRDADPLTLNLLDLESFCGAGRRLASRRLEDSSFGVEIRLLGDAAKQVAGGLGENQIEN